MTDPRSMPAKKPADPKPRAATEPAGVATPESAADVGRAAQPVEIGGPKGLEPTRYGDWERKGRCIDF